MNSIIYELANITKDKYGKMIKEVADKYHLAVTELEILLFIDHYQNCTNKIISESLCMIKSAVSFWVKALELKKLITTKKDENNRRIIYLSTTKGAEGVITEGNIMESKFYSLMQKGFSEEELQQVKVYAEKVIKNLKDKSEDEVC